MPGFKCETSQEFSGWWAIKRHWQKHKNKGDIPLLREASHQSVSHSLRFYMMHRLIWLRNEVHAKHVYKSKSKHHLHLITSAPPVVKWGSDALQEKRLKVLSYVWLGYLRGWRIGGQKKKVGQTHMPQILHYSHITAPFTSTKAMEPLPTRHLDSWRFREELAALGVKTQLRIFMDVPATILTLLL